MDSQEKLKKQSGVKILLCQFKPEFEEFAKMESQENQEGLSVSQVAWAKKHDWFVRVCRCQPEDNTQGFVIGVIVRQEDVLESGEVEVELVCFTKFQELKDWAGY